MRSAHAGRCSVYPDTSLARAGKPAAPSHAPGPLSNKQSSPALHVRTPSHVVQVLHRSSSFHDVQVTRAAAQRHSPRQCNSNQPARRKLCLNLARSHMIVIALSTGAVVRPSGGCKAGVVTKRAVAFQAFSGLLFRHPANHQNAVCWGKTASTHAVITPAIILRGNE